MYQSTYTQWSEQFDIYDIPGKGKFSRMTIYQCGSYHSLGNYTIRNCFNYLWNMISILILVKGTNYTDNKIDFYNKLLKYRIISKKSEAIFGGILMKNLINQITILELNKHLTLPNECFIIKKLFCQVSYRFNELLI
ncbi:unnamed protein product [Paramecium pentaurelia]|uniref:Uncharacterized protein n=1 Tax=Paramecium pentaurelia TaxID=43138 RepID=A0A8S1YRL1_9CILI|nr:unnamed protein product [Paramecium pentaurelia]